MYADQQRFWTALLNLQRTWATDDAAIAFIPPRFRDFESKPDWPRPKAQAYLLNNLELIRENYRRLEAGEPLEYELLNHGMEDLRLKLQPWTSPAELKRAATAKSELGGRLEVLQVTPAMPDVNPGTHYVRATIQRSLYYFGLYIDSRLSDPLYPEVSPGSMHVYADPDGDLRLTVATAGEPAGGSA